MKTKDAVKMGFSNNAKIRFNILHDHAARIDFLEINICSGDNQDFNCTTTINGVTISNIDTLCEKLRSLKEKLLYEQCS